jgi:O-antigen/teichoic acid export membrane protein
MSDETVPDGSEGEAGRTIMRGAQATALGFAIRFAARLVFLFVAGRLYGELPFGAYVLASAMVELAVSVGSLSTKKTLFPLLDRHEESGARPLAFVLVDAALLVVFVSLLLAASFMAAALVLPVRLLPAATAAALFMLAPMIAGQALLDLFLAAARWRQKVRYEVISRSLIEPYALAAGALLAFLLGFTERGLLVGYWCGTLAALLYAIWGVTNLFPGFAIATYRPSGAVFRAILGNAASNSATDLLSALYMRVDVYLVGVLLGEGATGIYGMARQVTTPIRQVRQSFDGLLIPAVAKTIGVRGAGGTGEALATATRLILVIQLPILIALVAIGARLMSWLGHGFAGGYWPLVILAAAELLQSALGIGDLVFVYLKPRIGLYLTLLSIAVGIGGALLLIPVYGLIGAAASVFAAYALRTALRSLVLRTQFALAVPRSHLAGPFAAAAAGTAAAWLIPNDLAGAAVGLALYALLLGLWLKATGQGLSLTGFAAEGRQRPA